ncbi:hypothetical protein [Aquimarina longa]|nr:hypothetical protein [Aquimarina longa]
MKSIIMLCCSFLLLACSKKTKNMDGNNAVGQWNAHLIKWNLQY